MKFLNEAITFLFELFMLTTIFLLMWRLIANPVIAIAAALAISGLIILVWGNFLAPTGKKRLPMVAGLLVTTLLTAFGPLAFYLLWPGVAALAIAGVYLLNRVLAIAWRQW